MMQVVDLPPFTTTIPLSDISKYFNRIGQYDFTKKDEDKIEFIDGVDTTNPIDSPFIIDKINELIEAVNELQEDYNKRLEAHKQNNGY